VVEPKQHHSPAGQREADQGAGNARTDPLAQRDDGQNSEADHERKRVRFVQMRDQGRQLLQHRPVGRRQPEYARQLRNQDVRGNAREKARRHRDREQIRNPAEAKNSGGEKQ